MRLEAQGKLVKIWGCVYILYTRDQESLWEVYKALLIGEVASSTTRVKGFENDTATRAKCEMHDWPARECKCVWASYSIGLKCTPVQANHTVLLSYSPPSHSLTCTWATPTFPNGVAAIPPLSIEEAVVSSTFNSKEKYVLRTYNCISMLSSLCASFCTVFLCYLNYCS